MAITLDYTKIFGYYSPTDIESVADSSLRKFLVFHNVMNAAATFLSPIAGVIRAIGAAVMFHFYSKQYPNTEDKTVMNIKQFMVAQMVRGSGELLCFGTIFGVIDVVVTLNRYELLCFSKSEASFRQNIEARIPGAATVKGWVG